MGAVRDMVTEHTIDLSTSKGHYFETGRGYPTILVHGSGFSSGGQDWFPVIKEGLGEVTHIYAIDQLGWGSVERPQRDYEFAFLVDHIREFQDVLGYEKTNVVGHSLGGWVAATLAYESPDRVNKLVCVANAGLNIDPPPNFANFVPPDAAQIAADLEHMEDPELRAEVLAAHLANGATADALDSYRSLGAMFRDMDMRRRYFLHRKLTRIKVPTLMVFGDEDLIFPSPEGRAQMDNEIPDSRAVLLKNTGHQIPTQRPKELAALLKDFLR
ncbi:MAG: alpha/beta hydrolase [Phenylobacterium sp.]|uniref:alpha/beta fold hydrolase n=1 Tax=Phenylobacterium sp. TaxID=1871053 RepID=UPI002733497D|nr:alpha/beta hydrolase [Phenylobacterium sp.]MDP3174460.1 alpha/beta hydrolase [Phenylobacterium sp.]